MKKCSPWIPCIFLEFICNRFCLLLLSCSHPRIHHSAIMNYELYENFPTLHRIFSSGFSCHGDACSDLLIFFSGRKRLSLVKRHIQSLIAGLFNIILHLQNPLIFYGRFFCDKGDSNPDPGSVILMCVEVLIRVAGKHALFQMDAWHVAQSFRIPAALFQDFCQLKLSEAPISSHSSLILDNQASDPLASTNICVVDRYFSIELFAACCRLLHTVLKHHKRCGLSLSLSGDIKN